MKGLWRLTWLEIKIFVREPLGLFGTVGVPVLVFLVPARLMQGAASLPTSREAAFLATGLPVLAAIPGLGALFGTTKTTTSTTELFLFLTPHIMRTVKA